MAYLTSGLDVPGAIRVRNRSGRDHPGARGSAIRKRATARAGGGPWHLTINPETEIAMHEDDFQNCVSIRGGAVHTATPNDGPEMHLLPLCRTGAQNHLRTRYTLTTLDLTCTRCIAIRERREARLAGVAK